MSGHAAIALVLLRNRGQFATLTICSLGEPTPPSQRESPFPVDFYLSWMSRFSFKRNQKANRTPNSTRRAVSAVSGAPSVEEDSIVFTAVTFVWLTRFELRALKLSVRG